MNNIQEIKKEAINVNYNKSLPRR